MHVPLTPLDFLDRADRLFPDRVGVVEGERRWTYRQYAERCHRLAHGLRDDLGVEPGDRVAWLGPNTHELLEAYYGVLLAGAVLVPLNIRLSPAELRDIVADGAPTVLVRHPSQTDPGVDVRQVTLGDDYEALLVAQPARRVALPGVAEDDPAEIFYTSGSTGSPKGALLTHRTLYLHAVHAALTMGIGGDDVVLHTIPLFHVNGWGTPHYLTALGGVHVMLERFDAADVLALVERERVTRLFLVPTMVQAVLAEAEVSRRDLSSLRQVSIGGAPAPAEMVAAVERVLGCECICGYGMTETAPQLTKSLDKPGEAPALERRATTGLPIVGVDLRVVDDHGTEVPWDGETVGEITVRSNHVMDGYWNAPEATAEVVRDGRLHTGDLAVVRPDGYIVIVDRAKDLIVSGGENIASPEVERCLLLHPAVEAVAVVGVSDPKWGEVPKAWVVLGAGAEASEPELIEWVRERLAHFKAPRHVAFVEALPTGGTGKVQKDVLRERG